MAVQIPTDDFIKHVMSGDATKKDPSGVIDVYKKSQHKVAKNIVQGHTSTHLDRQDAALALDIYEEHEGFAQRNIAEQKLEGAFTDQEVAAQHMAGTAMGARTAETDAKAKKAARKKEELEKQRDEDAKAREEAEKKKIEASKKKGEERQEEAHDLPIG